MTPKNTFLTSRKRPAFLEFSQDKTFEEYDQDMLVKSGVERQLAIAGEALTQMRKHFPDVAGKIREHRRITAFRNILVHGYADVKPVLVWKVLKEDLPVLQKEVAKLLKDYQEGL